MLETVPFSCYHLHCLKKSQKDTKAQGVKYKMVQKYQHQRKKQLSIPLWEGDEWQMLSVYFDSLWYLSCIFIIIILATSFLELNLFGFKFIYLFIYLLMAVLGLHCCAQAFSSCREQGLLFLAVRGLLTAVASLVARRL